MNSPTMPTRRPGRPLSFDRDAALHQAMLLFWRHGYETTSISDLTAAMGVTPPSLYGAFGDKKRLFQEAVDRYLAGRDTPRQMIVAAETAEAAARSMLRHAALTFTGADTPAGCLLATAAITGSNAAADIQSELAAIRQGIESALRDAIERDVAAGRLGPETDAETLAATIVAMVQGMSTAARDGASREKLERMADQVMRAWPGTPPP